MIELRALTPDDWRLWRELRLAALAEAPHAFGSTLADWQGDADREQRWRDRLELTGSHNIVAFLDGHPVGMASGVASAEAGFVEVISMWVHPRARGRGVGDRLLAEVEGWAREVGAAVVRLGVTEGNQPAAALYTRNGYGFTGEPGELMPDGVHCERVMAKRLDADQG